MNSWGNLTGFGASNALSSGLFGNSLSLQPNLNLAQNSPNNAKRLFGTTQPNTTQASGGLFGNSSTSTNGSLFGNSSSGAAKPASSGLFGNTASNQSTSNGLFGNSGASANPGGLFGGTSNTSNSGGLFGNPNSGSSQLQNPISGIGSSNVSDGLFSKPATNPATGGGLFGNSSSGASTGLFNKTANPAPTAGLFGNSNGGIGGNTNASGGLFSNSGSSGGLPGMSTTSGGLFGKPNASNGLFGGSSGTTLFGSGLSQSQPSTQVSAASTNPYSNSILSSISRTEATMPQSITGNLFAEKPTRRSSTKSSSLSMFSKFFKVFNVFSSAVSTTAPTLKPNGLLDYRNSTNRVAVADGAKHRVLKKAKNSTTLTIPASAALEMTKLVVKSKPIKFHLINADKVMTAKKRRVLVLSRSPDGLPRILADDDESDAEEIEENHTQPLGPIISETSSVSSDSLSDLDNPELNNGYWCSPSIGELSGLTFEELSLIDNFIVGRLDHGQIAYNYPVDLAPVFRTASEQDVSVAVLLFGNVFKFSGSTVRVYEDAETKPPIGTELNVPATITLRAIPKSTVSQYDHIKRLQKLTGMEFVTYDPLTCNWTFKVKHFSVWGLIDDSEAEGDEDEETKRLRALKKKQDDEENEMSSVYTRIYENDTYRQELKRQRISKYTDGIPGGWNYDASMTSGGLLAIKQAMVKDEINKLLDKFKTGQRAKAFKDNISDITYESDDDEDEDNDALLSKIGSPGASNLDYLRLIANIIPSNTDIDDLVDEKAYEPDLEDGEAFSALTRKPTLNTSSNWLVQLELANDLNSALVSYHTIPRKKNTSARAVNDILFSDTSNRLNVDEVSTPIKARAFENSPPLITPAEDFRKLEIFFQKLLTSSSVTSLSNGFPSIKFNDAVTFADIKAIDNDEDDASLLDLASILFDRIEKNLAGKDVTVRKRLELYERREKLSEWLKTLLGKDMEDQMNADSPLDEILHLVCRGEVNEAVSLASSSHNAHLAALLTLIDSNDQAVKKIAAFQLEEWETTKSTQLIPRPVVSIYQILAGEFEKAAKELPLASDLSLRVFYGNIAQELTNLFELVNIESLPIHVGEILRIYNSYKLNTVADTSDQIRHADLSNKIKWILFNVLPLIPASNTDANVTGEEYGKQLEAAGFWKGALYVFGTLRDEKQVEENTRRVVIAVVRRLNGSVESEKEYLQHVARIPVSLVYEAIALAKADQKDFWGRGEALAGAQLWDEAHLNICDHLGPLTVISEVLDQICRLKRLLDQFPDGGSHIPDWNQGAGFYKRYFDALIRFEKDESIAQEDILFLLENVGFVNTKGAADSNVVRQILYHNVGRFALVNDKTLYALKSKLSTWDLDTNERSFFGVY